MDKGKIALAVACVVGGVFAYYWFADMPVIVRVLMVLAGIGVGAAVAYTSEQGKQFFAFAQESWAEASRVSWPSRKETVQTTGVVFAFVVVMALFLFAVDSVLAWVVQMIRGAALTPPGRPEALIAPLSGAAPRRKPQAWRNTSERRIAELAVAGGAGRGRRQPA